MHPLVEIIEKAQDIILSTHVQPDGDGLGCEYGLYWAFKKAGKRPRIINSEPLPKKYAGVIR
jgi:phosphoesterase RecJ-like protein